MSHDKDPIRHGLSAHSIEHSGISIHGTPSFSYTPAWKKDRNSYQIARYNEMEDKRARRIGEIVTELRRIDTGEINFQSREQRNKRRHALISNLNRYGVHYSELMPMFKQAERLDSKRHKKSHSYRPTSMPTVRTPYDDIPRFCDWLNRLIINSFTVDTYVAEIPGKGRAYYPRMFFHYYDPKTNDEHGLYIVQQMPFSASTDRKGKQAIKQAQATAEQLLPSGQKRRLVDVIDTVLARQDLYYPMNSARATAEELVGDMYRNVIRIALTDRWKFTEPSVGVKVWSYETPLEVTEQYILTKTWEKEHVKHIESGKVVIDEDVHSNFSQDILSAIRNKTHNDSEELFKVLSKDNSSGISPVPYVKCVH